MAGTETSIWGAGQELIPGPKGDKGDPGPAPTLEVGTVSRGVNPEFVLTETSPGTYSVDVTLPRGNTGNPGNPGPQGEPGPQGAPGLVQGITGSPDINVDNTDPANPALSLSESFQDSLSAFSDKLDEIVPGEGIAVDNTNPTAPVVSALESKLVVDSVDDPTTTDIPAGQYRVWHNTSSGEVRLWANVGGTLLYVELVDEPGPPGGGGSEDEEI